VGLEVGLASVFPLSIGLLQEASVRRWDSKLKIYRFDEPAPPIDIDELSNELSNKYLWVSREALIHACQISQPKRHKLLSWLLRGRGSDVEFYAVTKDIAEYLP
jgi:hypothetical protein